MGRSSLSTNDIVSALTWTTSRETAARPDLGNLSEIRAERTWQVL
jgi:hypothetical protein